MLLTLCPRLGAPVVSMPAMASLRPPALRGNSFFYTGGSLKRQLRA